MFATAFYILLPRFSRERLRSPPREMVARDLSIRHLAIKEVASLRDHACVSRSLLTSLPSRSMTRLRITRGHARKRAGRTERARKLKDLVRARGEPASGPLVRVWGMRLLVSRLCGSINACAPRARSVAAAARQSHTFSELRTLGRAPLLSFAGVRGVLVFYEARGRLFIYTTDEILLRRGIGDPDKLFTAFPAQWTERQLAFSSLVKCIEIV